MPPELKNALLASTLVALLGSCSHAPNGQYVPPEALSPPAGDLAEGIAKFGNDVQKESLSGYRRAAREDLIRANIYNFFTGSDWTPGGHSVTPQGDIFCRPRYGYLRIAGPLQNTTARGIAVKDLLKAPSDSLGDLFKALGDKYKVDPMLVSVEKDYTTWSGSANGKFCLDRIENGDPFLTRPNIGNEAGLVAAAAAGKILFDTIWTIVEPALKGGLQNIDKERRNTAVQQFFADPTNVGAMKDDIKHVETFLTAEFELAQKRAAGKATAQYAALTTYDSVTWKAALVAANAPGCQAAIRNLKHPPKGNSTGVACLRTVFDVLNPTISMVLDAGDNFDVAMDKTLPKDKLSDQIDTVALIAQGKQPDEQRLKALWGALMRYSTLYDTVKTAASDANQKKLKDAAEAFAEALK